VVSRGRVEERTLEVPTHSWASTPWNGIQDSVHAIQRHWLDCLRTGRTPETSGEDTLRLLRLAFASYRSADRAEAVHLDGGDGAAPGTLSPRSTQ
jgi:predicted dehydrogenase